MFVVITLFFVVPSSPLLREKQTLPQRFLASGGSITERKVIWKTTSRMIKQSHGIGVGIGQFKLHYLPVYASNPFEIKKLSHESDFPRQNVTEAHNEYLHFFAETGFIGLFAFVWLCLYIFLRGLHTLPQIKNPRESIFHPAALSSFLSLCFTSFFGFPFHLPQTLAMFCLVSAYLVQPADKEIKPPVAPSSPFFPMLGILCVLTSIAVTIFSLKTFSSSIHLRSARKAQAAHDHAAAQKEFEKALSLTPNDGETFFYYGIFLVHIGKFQESYTAFKKAEETTSNLNLTMALAKSAQILKKHDEALQKYNFVLQLYPWKEYQCAAYLELGNIYSAQKKNIRAAKAFRGALLFCEKEALRGEILEKIKRTYRK